jgi:hypothetical protein
MSFTVAEFHDLVRLVEERPEWRAELRRLVLTDELLALPEEVARLRQATEQGFQRLTEAQARTEQQLVTLSQAQARTEEQLTILSQAQARTEQQLITLSQAQARTEEQLTILSQAQARTEQQLVTLSQAQVRTEERLAALSQEQASMGAELRWLANWQRGEAGRRDGERYERDILRQAPALFNGGSGGAADQSDIQQRLTAQLGALLAGNMLNAAENPFLADLLWWKGEEVAVVEVSLQVDRQDVSRAEQRAATVRRSGAQVRALVIGEQWATAEAREQAQARRIDWKVDADISEGFLTFRRQ